MSMKTIELLRSAKAATTELAQLSAEQKGKALLAMADALEEQMPELLRINAEEVEAARDKISNVMLDRLALDPKRIRAMADGIRAVADLADPIGEVLEETVRADGLRISKIRVPMGVVAIIYESRPNVTSDAAALALKSGNVCILRCGKESFRTSYAIVSALRNGLRTCGLNESFINMPTDSSHAIVQELMTATEYVDLLIPRGGAGLIRACVEHATVPCIQTGTGICHVYVDRDADLEKALNILENAKTSRPSVCNAAEVCLVHREIADAFLPMLQKRLTDGQIRKGKPAVTLRLDPRAAAVISGTSASDADFDTEFLDYILAIKVVDDTDEAIRHIAEHSTHHSDCIVTENTKTASAFTSAVDSAVVYVNASTRFTDGGEFGFGCEIGISTQKLHARGPMGLKELTAYKYVVRGNGQIR